MSNNNYNGLEKDAKSTFIISQTDMIEMKPEGFNKYHFLSFLLLLAPLIMGFHISALFNEDVYLFGCLNRFSR